MSKPIIAIVGRPNVGKSTLFNKLIGERRSIVEDTPGVTRDRIYGECEWNGRKMTVIDTGGIEPKTDDNILKSMRLQAEIAIESADVIVFITDVKTGLVADDRDIAVMLKKSGKPVVLCVNKCDRIGQPPYEYYEFFELGYDDDPIVLSSLHGTGTGDLLDAVVNNLPPEVEEEEEHDRIRIAVIGKPNAGKSSLINKIIGSDRMIVSPMAGTTRDAVDTDVDNEHGKYTLIDTAGIRRSAKINDKIEKYSVLRAHMAVEKADVCLLVIDATEGVTEQDEKIAGIAHETGKPCVIVVNKWDAIDKDGGTYEEFRKNIYNSLSYMTYASMITLSAKTGQRVDSLFEFVNKSYEHSCLRIGTGSLNDVLREAMERVQPPSDKGKRLKIYYMTQVSTCPPTFVIFCNNSELFHFSYQRYIENTLRQVFDFSGTPIRIVIRERGEDND